jgi:hypothetical protein
MTTIVNDNNDNSSNNEMNPGDTEMWPSLNAAASPLPELGQKVTKQVVWNVNHNVGEPTDQEGWELLTEGDDDDDAEEKEAHNNNETEQETPVVYGTPNRLRTSPVLLI